MPAGPHSTAAARLACGRQATVASQLEAQGTFCCSPKALHGPSIYTKVLCLHQNLHFASLGVPWAVDRVALYGTGAAAEHASHKIDMIVVQAVWHPAAEQQ